MILDVPLIRQPKDSKDCGIAGMAMILNYDGKKIGFEKLCKEIDVDNTGTYAPQLGTYMIHHGYDITLVTMHPALFTLNDRRLTKVELKKRFQELLDKTKNNQNKKVLNYFIEFIDAGGKIIVKTPTKEDIENDIKNKRPLGALMTTNFLNGKTPVFNFHFNIITGIDDKYIYANDPMWDERGGKKKYEINDFFYGLYSSAYADLDNACLILIRKIDKKQ